MPTRLARSLAAPGAARLMLMAAVALLSLRCSAPEVASMTNPAASPADQGALSPALSAYLDARQTELSLIDGERRKDLQALARHVRDRLDAGATPRLLFVCTHNSRRSHMAQLWAAAGAARFGLPVQTFSGGTEATAFNPRAVAAMERAGFLVDRPTGDSINPRYELRLVEGGAPQVCFSKRFGDALLPGLPFAAVMVCGEADQACPNVPGAIFRLPLTYVDPKLSDGTPAEAATYDERCAQIAREMLYVMEQARG